MDLQAGMLCQNGWTTCPASRYILGTKWCLIAGIKCHRFRSHFVFFHWKKLSWSKNSSEVYCTQSCHACAILFFSFRPVWSSQVVCCVWMSKRKFFFSLRLVSFFRSFGVCLFVGFVIVISFQLLCVFASQVDIFCMVCGWFMVRNVLFEHNWIIDFKWNLMKRRNEKQTRNKVHWIIFAPKSYTIHTWQAIFEKETTVSN